MGKTINSLLVLIVFCLTGLSCGSNTDEGPSLQGTELSISDIQGTWTATSAIFNLSMEGPVVQVDVVAEGGSVNLQIQSNGRFTLTIAVMGRTPEVSTGQLGFDEDLLTVAFDGDDPGDYEYYSIDSSPNTLDIGGPAEFDFDGDGTEEPAIVDLYFVRS